MYSQIQYNVINTKAKKKNIYIKDYCIQYLVFHKTKTLVSHSCVLKSIKIESYNFKRTEYKIYFN